MSDNMSDNIDPHPSRNPPRASKSAAENLFSFDLDESSPYTIGDNEIPGRHNTFELAERLDQMRKSAYNLGFVSLFDVALAEARRDVGTKSKSKEDMLQFVQHGCFNELVSLFKDSGSFGRVVNGNIIKNPLPDDFVSIMSRNLYLEDWRTLLASSTSLNRSFNDFTPDDVSNFDFATVYKEMKDKAPNLVILLESLAVDKGPGAYKEITVTEKQKIFLVSIIATLSKLKNGHLNYVQGIIGLYLYACRTTKRVITTLNHLGISASYDSILKYIDITADAARAQLKSISAIENVF